MLFLSMLLLIGLLTILRRKIDLIWVLCISFIIYFYPFVDDSLSFYSPLGSFEYVISPYTQFVVNVFAGILICYLLLERAGSFKSVAYVKSVGGESCRGYAQVTAALVVLSLVVVIAQSGGTLFENDKPELMKQLGYGYKFFSVTTLFLLCLSYFSKWRFGLALVAVALAFDLFLGFRTTAAFAALLFLCLYFSNFRLDLRRMFFVLSLVIILFLVSLVFKPLLIVIKTGNSDFFLNLLQGENNYKYLTLVSESTTISIVLNEILSTNFSVKSDYLLDVVCQLIPFLSNMLDMPAVSFADYYKQGLMGEEAASFASSFWGAAFASLGAIGMFFVFIAWLAVICILNCRVNRPNVSCFEKSIWMVSGIPLAFYIHRNDFIFQYSLFKSTLITAAIIYLAREFTNFPTTVEVVTPE